LGAWTHAYGDGNPAQHLPQRLLSSFALAVVTGFTTSKLRHYLNVVNAKKAEGKCNR